MAQTIQLKRSAVTGRIPQLADLSLGELAINTTDGKAYLRRSGSAPTPDQVLPIVVLGTQQSGSLYFTGSSEINLASASEAPNYFEINADTSTVFYVTGSQRIGIGTADPKDLLHVYGSSVHGTSCADSHQFTGSVEISCSLAVNGVDFGTFSSSLESRLVLEEATSSDHETRIDLLEVTASEFDTRLDNVEATASRNEATASDHETRIDLLEATASEFDTRLDNVEATASRNEATASDHETRLDNVEATASRNEATASDHETRIDNIELSGSTGLGLWTGSGAAATRESDVQVTGTLDVLGAIILTASIDARVTTIAAGGKYLTGFSGVAPNGGFILVSSLSSSGHVGPIINDNDTYLTTRKAPNSLWFAIGNNPKMYITASTGDVIIMSGSQHGHDCADRHQFTGSLEVSCSADFTGDVNISGDISASNVYVADTLTAAVKSFDIDHPTKDGYRLQHVCLEGPEAGVYYRGKLSDEDVIELPDYWTGLVDEDSITVNLTPYGTFQQLYIKEIADNKIFIGNEGSENKPSCHFVVYAERKDVDKLKVEYI